VTSRRTFLKVAASTAAASAFPRIASAQSWPTHPIRAIIPFSAGSTIDILGRLIADPLGAALGQPIVIDNRGGAGGSLGTAIVAKSEPNGYTLLIHASAHSAAPAVYAHLPYDPVRDIAAVANFGVVPNVLVVASNRGIKTPQQLVELAKKGNLSFASAGVGSASHWGAERFRASAGFHATHVPYKGGVEALTDVMTGRVDFMSNGLTSALPFIKEGRLTPLAVSTRKRSSILPDIPTTLELGYKNSDYIFWNALLAPARTPRPIIERLYTETMKVLQLPAVQEKLRTQGVDPMPLTPKEFDAMIAQEIKANIALAKSIGIKGN
jgi:tripartite-type tricarboxylate transporter receptor subunit TctC